MVTDTSQVNQHQVIKETALVVSIEGDYAWVEAKAKSGCGSCEINQSCGTGLLSQLFGRRAFHHRIKNTLNVEPGDTVVVTIPQGGLLLASLVIYSVPLIALFITAMLADSFSFPEWGIVLVGALGLGLGILVSRWLGKQLENSEKTQISMLCKLESNMVLQIE